MRAYLFAAILLSALPLAAQAKHPFTFEDRMALKAVEEPVPSPDGKWVLFAAVDVDLTANTKTPHSWEVRLVGIRTTMPTSPKIRETSGTPVVNERLFRIRMRTGRDGRRTGSGLRLCRPKKADRKFGSRILMPPGEL